MNISVRVEEKINSICLVFQGIKIPGLTEVTITNLQVKYDIYTLYIDIKEYNYLHYHYLK